MMTSRLGILTAALAVCVSPATALPQNPSKPFWLSNTARDNQPSLPALPQNPYDPQKRVDALNSLGSPDPFGSPGPGPHGVLPPEPGIAGIIGQKPQVNSNSAPPQTAPGTLDQLLNPPAPKFDPHFRPMPTLPPRMPTPPWWQGLGDWEATLAVAGFIIVLASLAGPITRKEKPVESNIPLRPEPLGVVKRTEQQVEP